MFFRAPRATLPRIYLYRSAASVLLFVLVFSFWLFFGARLGGLDDLGRQLAADTGEALVAVEPHPNSSPTALFWRASDLSSWVLPELS